ncbi:MAG: rod shape-determining protein MreD [Spirochaetaceae bacterium]|jgi:rod shape-determining protein MreD|nr:rod shape-determining protein MreD [Spirochaetaceae bacterium]
MAKKVVWTSIFTLVAIILQSTLLYRLAPYEAVPDLALGILVYSAYMNSAMTGQFSGFFSGLFLDFLSAAPLGLNTLIRTIIGAAIGRISGTFFPDALFFPMALCAGATILKAAMLFLLHLLFREAAPFYSLYDMTFWMELLLNTLSAPFLFALLRLFKPLLIGKEEI